MKSTLQILITFIVLFSSIAIANAQNSETKHTFKIAGNNRLPDTSDPAVECLAEYDAKSKDHLIITALRKDGSIISQVSCRFTGKNFRLEKKDEYTFKKELIPDGITRVYGINNTIEGEMRYENGQVVETTTFFENGNKHMLLSTKENLLNGPYKIWFENGNLCFEGNYTSNKKDGQFRQFNDSGTMIGEGVYENGKLVSGKAVVLDQLYKNPDVKARYKDGEPAFSEEIMRRSLEMNEVKLLNDSFNKFINIRLFIEKTGTVSDVGNLSPVADDEKNIIKSVFADFPGFVPAEVEGVPVKSMLDLEVQLSKNGIKYFPHEELDTTRGAVYYLVEEMPMYPGGIDELRKFIANNIRYPVYAQENGIEGKVYVTFVIETDGSVNSFKIERGIHPVLNEEAIRVLKLMPRWEPGKQRGENVRVKYTVPVGFIID